jgi:RNA polymerase sigma-70 factor, ECF subfamily
MGMPEQPGSELELSRLVDAELVRVAREGSASALRLIVRRHNQRLYRVARAIVRDDSEAEDVMQEAYLSALANLAKFRADASLATWLTRIVMNKAINRLRRQDVAVGLDAVDNLERPEGEIAGKLQLASEIDPETTAARNQVRDLLERAIDNLPDPFRVVFVMRMVEELSVKETASSLGIREETVKSRLHRAKKMMREQLEPTLATALTDTFPFQDPRCRDFTDALVARLVEKGPAGQLRQHHHSQT